MPTAKAEPSGYEILGKITSGTLQIPVLAASIVLRGYILSYLWTWFFTPKFHVVAPPILMCIGMGMFFKYLVNGATHKTREKTEEEKALEFGSWKVLASAIESNLLFFGIAWLVHYFA